MPFKAVSINGSIEGPIATLDIKMTYLNPENQHAIECSYEFPLDKNTIFASLEAKIENRSVKAKVKEL